jgi:fido (protein-threonine AMPylation protein)
VSESESGKPDFAERRDSVACEPELIVDPKERAEAEARNGLRQFDFGRSVAQESIDRQGRGDYRFRLRPSLILSLHREALAGISSYAGNYRPSTVSIKESRHTPPGAHLVAEMVEDMCDYVNESWPTATPIHLAAYVMWRLNWIHPFADGNGRTSRITSYVVLTIKSGFILPGSPTIPDQIVSHRNGYFQALDAADLACKEGRTDVSMMEELLAGMLARQLTEFYRAVGGKLPPDIDLSTS